MFPISYNAYKFMHDFSRALSDAHYKGMRVDVDYCRAQQKHIERRISFLESQMSKCEEGKVWKTMYGGKLNWDSTQQQVDVLIKNMGHASDKKTAKQNISIDEEVLRGMNIDFTKFLLERKKLSKASGTYLKNLIDETVDGYVHPVYNLHLVITYRSSADSPPIQQIPIHDDMIAQIIRRAFVTEKGYMMMEADFKGAEVRVSACNHGDPVMANYIMDEKTDMHLDTAKQCFMLTDDLITKENKKDIKFFGKNNFVFAEFYGSWFLSCARALWKSIHEKEVVLGNGQTIIQHLASKGITKLGELFKVRGKWETEKGTFIEHIKKVEDDFWNNRFKVYKQWKIEHFEKYQNQGYFDMFTGFRCSGVMGFNDAVNYPIQGPSFHCLGWVFIKVSEWIKENKLKTKVIGQIHDSIIMYVHPSEVSYVYERMKQMIEVELMQAWKWITIPMKADFEATPVDGSWYDKKALEI